MRNYHRLNLAEREVAALHYHADISIGDISRRLDRSPPTISRELCRNRTGFYYVPVIANNKADAGVTETRVSDLRVLIAGNGHVRRDSGVPRYILALDKTAVIVSIGMFEVAEGKNDISAYEKDLGGDGLPFNYVWFTACADRDDPCIEFIKQYNKKD